MKVAFIHDWFKANGGAEKVAGDILDVFENDDVVVYTLFNCFTEADSNEILKNHTIKVSLLQYVPFIARIYRFMLPVMPFLMKRFRLKDYDVIVSSSHAVAKGFYSDPGILNICYCHTPMRYVWDMYDDYAAHHAYGKWFLYGWFVNRIRKWDYESARHVHYFLANSHHVQQRIENSYKRPSTVIYPGVRVDKFALSEQERGDYYLCMGRFVPYKKADLVIRAFQQMPDKKLYLIGAGYGTRKFNKMLKQYPNIVWLGYRKDDELIRYIQGAKACIFAAKEDFGIMCVEVQACGTPVLALDYGGYKETVIAGETGYFFKEQTEQSIIEAVNRFEAHPLRNHQLIRANTIRFSVERFKKELSDFVSAGMKKFYKKEQHEVVENY